MAKQHSVPRQASYIQRTFDPVSADWQRQRKHCLHHAIWCFLFFLLLADVIKHLGSLHPLNLFVYDFMQHHASITLNKLALGICFFGDKFDIYPTMFLFSVWLFWKKQPRLALCWLALLIISSVGVWGAKVWVASPRPGKIIEDLGGFYSYPSGHTTLATMCCGFLYLTVAPTLHTIQRYLLTIVCFLITFSVFLARIYIGAHWFTDVIAGLLWGYICYNLVGYFYLSQPSLKTPAKQIPTFLAILIVITAAYASVYHHKLLQKFNLLPNEPTKIVNNS